MGGFLLAIESSAGCRQISMASFDLRLERERHPGIIVLGERWDHLESSVRKKDFRGSMVPESSCRREASITGCLCRKRAYKNV